MFSWMTLTSPLSAPARFAMVMDGLKQAVAAKSSDYPWTGPMVLYVWNRLHRINAIFQALAALIIAGKLPPERVCRPRTPRVQSAALVLPEVARLPETPKPVWQLFPCRFGWLCGAVPSLARRFGAAQFGSQLQYLLGDPEMIALIAASPRMRRTLCPLLWMLGIEASLIRPPPPPQPPPSVVESACAVVGEETTDTVSVAANLVCPSYPPGEVSAMVPDGQSRDPEVFART
jgi:hypothetical protein